MTRANGLLTDGDGLGATGRGASSGRRENPPFGAAEAALGPQNRAAHASSASELWSAIAYVHANGRRWHGGPVPYGWAPALSGWLLPDESEQRAVALARELRDEGVSLRRIARELTDAGYAPRHGGAWHPAQVARILTRTAI
jgi:hypothetical protein